MRIEFDSSIAPGWQTFDAFGFAGTLAPLSGTVLDTDENKVFYRTRVGVHGLDLDTFEFTATDCKDTSDPASITITVPEPAEDFDTAFEVFIVPADNGNTVLPDTAVLDISSIVKVYAELTGSAVEDMTVELHANDGFSAAFTASLGAESSSLIFSAASTLASGSKVEVWLASATTTPVFRAVALACVTGEAWDLGSGSYRCTTTNVETQDYFPFVVLAAVVAIAAISVAVWVKRSSAAQISVAKKDVASAKMNTQLAEKRSSMMGHEVDALKKSLGEAQTIITKQACHLLSPALYCCCAPTHFIAD